MRFLGLLDVSGRRMPVACFPARRPGRGILLPCPSRRSRTRQGGHLSATAHAGGGYVWDEVLEYRVWCHPDQVPTTPPMVTTTSTRSAPTKMHWPIPRPQSGPNRPSRSCVNGSTSTRPATAPFGMSSGSESPSGPSRSCPGRGATIAPSQSSSLPMRRRTSWPSCGARPHVRRRVRFATWLTATE